MRFSDKSIPEMNAHEGLGLIFTTLEKSSINVHSNVHF